MVSNGNYLVLIGSGGINLLDVGNSHSVIASTSASGFNNAFIESDSLYVVAEDGLHVWEGSLIEQPREYQRRAEPIYSVFGGRQWDITSTQDLEFY